MTEILITVSFSDKLTPRQLQDLKGDMAMAIKPVLDNSLKGGFAVGTEVTKR
jgi:hypothetical protein